MVRGILSGGFCPRGILSRETLSRGFCLGRFVQGDFVLEPAQTSGVEGYHSLVNNFAPKMFHFSFNSMKSRLLLATMHYSRNAGRDQQQHKQDDMEYTTAFPKYKIGGHIVRKI